MKTFDIKDLKKEIVNTFGSVAKLKQHLLNIAKNEYGCLYSEVQVYGCKVVYTSNTNCWAKFLITIPTVGMSNSIALGKSSINKVGIERGCGSKFIKL